MSKYIIPPEQLILLPVGLDKPTKGRRSVRIDDYFELARIRNFEWLGGIVPDTMTPTNWRCLKCNHTWKAKYNNIRNGKGCPKCAGNLKVTANEYHRLASLRGFKWVGDSIPSNVGVKTEWECQYQHRWLAEYENIKSGRGCPYCSKHVRITAADYHRLASEREYQWLGEQPPRNTKIKTPWRCPEGHEWLVGYDSVLHGSGCPTCDLRVNGVKASKPQIQIGKMLNGKVNYKIDGTRYRVDVALPDEKVAIEYDGYYWHQSGERQRARDSAIRNAGWVIVRIKSANNIPNDGELVNLISKAKRGGYAEITLSDWIDL